MDTPTTWPPRPGDTWHGPPNQTWHARTERGRLVLIPERIGSGSLWGGTNPDDVLAEWGPLTLTHRPETQPTDWELTLADAGYRVGDGWYRFILDRFADEDPEDPKVWALWAVVSGHSGADTDYCPGCDGCGCCEEAPTVAECETVRTVARVWADHPEHPSHPDRLTA